MTAPAVARAAVSAATRLALGRSSSGSAVVLAYHDVVADPAELTQWCVTAEQLRSHVTLLRRLGHRIVPLEELSRLVVEGADVSGLAALSFDDGLAGVARHAAPVLAELAAPATTMVVTAALGRPPGWWADVGPVMSRTDLQGWLDAGFDVASHTRTHASLPGLPPDRLRDEVQGSRRELEDLAARTVTQFAYPYGHHDPAVREEVVRAGYAVAYTFLNGRVRHGDDRYRLPRLTMGPHHGVARLAYHLGRGAQTWPEHQTDAVHPSEALS